MIATTLAPRSGARGVSSLADVLQIHAARIPEKQAFLFLEEGEHEGQCLTFAGLDRRARAIGSHLSRQLEAGARVLLLYPSGLEFLETFLGCLYAGMVAVPAYPPEPGRVARTLPRLQAVLQDARPAAVLTTPELLAAMEQFLAQAEPLRLARWMTARDLESDTAWTPPALSGDALAFLQYTSGSTAIPKGVMVSHRNLLHTLADSDMGLGHGPDSRMVTWLPAFHDLGLIYGLLLPLWGGFSCVMMPPASFLQHPLRWLRAISRYRGTHAPAPNFAYGLCVEKISREERQQLDLRSWAVALNAAEPIRRSTLQRFTETFAPCGFRAEAFSPAYGLAEFTVKVTSQHQEAPPSFLCVDGAALEAHHVREVDAAHPGARWIAGCGRPALDTRLEIVHPGTRERCGPGEVGEIWVTGTSLARGYWNRPEESAATFQATLADTGEGPFLRTGDLGFLWQGELFVTGRLKDLIVIRGRNHYPQDLEQTAEASHPALRTGCSAAFAVEVDGEEQVVLVAEVQPRELPRMEQEAVAEAVRRAVGERHEVHVHAVVLLKARTLPKTSSGKLQRRACKDAFLREELEAIARHVFPRPTRSGPLTSAPGSPRDGQAISTWISSRLARQLNIPVQEVDTARPLAEYGLDSEAMLELSADLGDWLGRKLPVNVVYAHPSINALASHLSALNGQP
jgi:acyl-CoA synthetase (AMP-forming)/AMP-acid ligase II/acyl carrier protein